MDSIKLTPYIARRSKGPVQPNHDVEDFVDVKTLPIDSYFKKLHQEMYHDSTKGMFLPQNCRYFYRQPITRESLYVIEQPPAYRTIFTTIDMGRTVDHHKKKGHLKKWGYEDFRYREKPYQFMLAFPYILYFISLASDGVYKSMTIFCRTTPLRGNIDALCKVPMSNIDEAQNVCIGDVNYSSNRFEALENVIKAFWQNKFNDDFMYNPSDYASDQYLGDLITWEFMSKQDPMFIYKVGWLKWRNTFRQQLDYHIQEMDSLAASNERSLGINWKLMLQAFQSTVETSKVDEDTDSEIMENITDAFFLKENVVLHQGDSLMIKGKRYFVESVSGPAATLEAKYVKLRDSDGKAVTFTLTESVKDFLYKKIIEQRYTTCFNFEGKEIKSGQIVKLYVRGVGELTRKVEYFRYSVDGKLEMKTTNSFIMMDRVIKIEEIEIDDITIDGVKLVVGQTYAIQSKSEELYTPSGTIGYYTKIRNLKYMGVDIEREGSSTLSAIFQDSYGEIITYPYRNIELHIGIIDKSEMIPLPRFFRVANTVFNTPEPSLRRFYEYKQKIVIEDEHYPEVWSHRVNIGEMIDNLIIENSFILRGIPYDLMFKIGDQVVVSDWENPLEMLKIKTIIGFVAKEESILFTLEDKHGNVTEKRMVRINHERNRIYVEFNDIRHIKTEHEGIRNGSKIIAQETGIANFPKKDRNIIIGFLEGTKVPQVLCSNACTLWFDEMVENFEIIDRDDKRYKRIKHSPINLTKIKPQQGDLMAIQSEDGQQYIVTRNPYGNQCDCGVCLDTLSETETSTRRFELNNYYNAVSVFKGFISPRIRKNLIRTFGTRRNLVPRFNGEYDFVNRVPFSLQVDIRRIVNDQ